MSLAVDLKAIDAALVARYSGISIDVDGTSTPVEVFIEKPGIEETPERIYPSISIQFLSAVENFYDSDDDSEEEVRYDDAITPHERSMRKRPIPMRVIYSVDTWHKSRASESRDLVSEALIEKTHPKGFITATNIDGASVDLWTFWSGGIVSSDESNLGLVVYHKTVTIEVHAHMTQVAYDVTTEEKVAMTLDWKVFSRTVVDTPDGISIVSGGDEKDVTIRVTDTTEEPVP